MSIARSAAALTATAALAACTASGGGSRPGEGTARPFAVVAGVAVHNTGTSQISGSVASGHGMLDGFPPAVVSQGGVFLGDAIAVQAVRDIADTYAELDQNCARVIDAAGMRDAALRPGGYCISGPAELDGTLTLDPYGDPDAVWVFRTIGPLTVAPGATVQVAGGVPGCAAFWQVAGPASIGAGATIVGDVVARDDITVGAGAQVFGRLLSRDGTVTLDHAHVDKDACRPPAQACMPCGATCVDLSSDRGNCGTCGATCSWDQQCRQGACACDATMCGTICVDLGRNPLNCGACGHACADGEWCDQGACTTACPSGAVCGGWCTDLHTDHADCGACGHACGAAETCSHGACVCTGATCGAACVDLGADEANCGACGHACGGGLRCQDGACVPR